MTRTAATTTPAPSCCAPPPQRPAGACRRSSRGCPSRPGPGSRGASSSPAAPAWRWRSTAPRRSRSRPSRAGSRRRRRATRSSSRSSSTAASTRSACSPRSATRATRSCARAWPRKKAPAPTFGEDPTPAVAPDRRRPRHPARRGQGLRLPGDRLRPPRPVALHLAPLLRDRRARRRLPHRLAGPLPRRSSATKKTRCRGSRWTARSRR